MRAIPRERGRQRRRNFRQLLLVFVMASVATLIVVQSALWMHGIKPTPVNTSSTLSSPNPPPANTFSTLNIRGDIILESKRNMAGGAIQGNATKEHKNEPEHHPVDIIASFKEGKKVTPTSAKETNSTTNKLKGAAANPKTSNVPLICRTRNLVWDQLIVADDTAFRPKTTPTNGRTTDTFSGATTISGSTSSTTASSSQGVSFPAVKLICFVMTHAEYHDTRIEAVRKTWGSRCDSLIIASNTTDTSMGTIAMNSEASYTGLWEKLNETMQYIYETYHPHRHSDSQNDHPSDSSKNNNDKTQQFYEEWILKADDDSYFIIENLRTFLASHQVQALHNPAAAAAEYDRNDTSYEGKTKQKANRINSHGAPLIYGRIYSAPRYKHLANRSVYFRNPVNFDFKSRFYAKMNPLEPVLYNYGGAGYVMNWNYVEQFVSIMKGPDTVHGIPPEDQAHGVVMAYHDIWPQLTFDELGRQRFHQESPAFMHHMSPNIAKVFHASHAYVGGIKTGPDCCSTRSISFHHMKPEEIKRMDEYLYSCRRQVIVA